MRRAALLIVLTLASCAPRPATTPPATSEDENSRVINGIPAERGSARWQIEIRRGPPYGPANARPEWLRYHSCGGALIAPDLVLTAAHCVSTSDIKKTHVVRAGDLDLRAPMRTYRIVTVTIHKDYRKPAKFGPSPHDIALLRIALDGPAIAVTEEPRPVALPVSVRASDLMPDTARVIATGWGATATDKAKDSSPSTLLAAVLRVLPPGQCRIPQARAPIDPKIHLCAGPDDPKRPANTCKGDSGGPLVWIDPANRPRLVGIVSWGTCGIGVPAIYTDVRAHLDWIERARAAPGGRV